MPLLRRNDKNTVTANNNATGYTGPTADTLNHPVHDTNNLTTTNADGVTIPAHGLGIPSTKGSGEKAFVGKLEHAAGTLLCSSTLRAKGLEKEREAEAIRIQASELTEAQRLEREAAARRERAAAHGAVATGIGGRVTGADGHIGGTGAGVGGPGGNMGPGVGGPGPGGNMGGGVGGPGGNIGAGIGGPGGNMGGGVGMGGGNLTGVGSGNMTGGITNNGDIAPGMHTSYPPGTGGAYAGDAVSPTAPAPGTYASGPTSLNNGPMNPSGGGMAGLR